jgi:hypothetical protein
VGTTADDIGLQAMIVVISAASSASGHHSSDGLILRAPSRPVRSSFRATRVNRATVSSPQSLQIGRPQPTAPRKLPFYDAQSTVSAQRMCFVDNFAVQKKDRRKVPSNDRSNDTIKPARHTRGAFTHTRCVREIIRTSGRRQNSVSDTSSGPPVTSYTAP